MVIITIIANAQNIYNLIVQEESNIGGILPLVSVMQLIHFMTKKLIIIQFLWRKINIYIINHLSIIIIN